MCHRCIGATNKALAKRRAAEDALRIIAQKEAAVAAAAVAQQAAELQAALAVPGMESTAPVSPSASPPTEDAAAAHRCHLTFTANSKHYVVHRQLV